MSKKLLITGCGRSGTRYISTLLNNLGLDIPHEVKMGKHGISSWLMAVPNPSYPWGPQFERSNFTHIVHQVREPLKTITSLSTFSPISWEYISKYIRIRPKDSILLKSMKYWYRWNKIAEKNSIFTYRVENLENIFPKFCIKIGYPYLKNKKNKINLIKTNINSRRKKYKNIMEWENLYKENEGLANKIYHQALSYGYNYAENN